MKLFSSKKGFTLVELVVVIAILGILAGIAIPRMIDATATARGAKLVADMRTIDSAAMIYQARSGQEPASIDALLTDAPTATPPTYRLLAAQPVPPVGRTTVTMNNGSESTATLGTTAVYSIGTGANAGRAIYAEKTVDAILSGGLGGL